MFNYKNLFNLTIILTLLLGCSSKNNGKLVFKANGEDFVRDGFVGKNNWRIDFDNLFVNIANIKAYNTGKNLEASLNKEYWIDLKSPDSNGLVTVDTLKNVKPGNYQSLNFELKKASDGEYKNYSIVLIGKAKKNNQTIPFKIKLDEELLFVGKEGYVGDEIKGLLKEKGTAETEMTFHFDHIFGDNSSPATDHVNTGSVGFDFFNKFAKDGKVDVTQQELKSTKNYKTFIKSIWTLGHLGEGHCDVLNQSTRI